ncbi:MAG TPA: hypothetical protein VFJ16_03060 [Longimicrobium sp.]|nr:hypothetical protein [Longimicrobium sp.]
METRAQAYAILRLTRRADVHVSKMPGIPGLDLLITAGGSKSRFRHCGVVLQTRLTAAEPAWVAPEAVDREQQLFSEATLPICMLSFPAEDPSDEPMGDFRWIVEPRVQGGKAFCTLNTSRDFQPLTDERLGQLVRELTEWYALRSREDHLLAAGIHDITEHNGKVRQRRAV